jgi:hypothetical protein
VNSEGDIISRRPEGASQYPLTYLQLEFEAHAGRAPIYSCGAEKGLLVGGAALGMSVRKAEGVYPVREDFLRKNDPVYFTSLYMYGDFFNPKVRVPSFPSDRLKKIGPGSPFFPPSFFPSTIEPK